MSASASAIVDPAVRLLLCIIGLYALRLARKWHAEADRQRALAKAWRASFTAYLTADLNRNEREKENAERADADELARRKGWS